jgi:hypothetical protein
MKGALETPTPARYDELVRALVHGLQFDGKKRYRASGEMMARITAQHLLQHLEMCGYVVMSRPARTGQTYTLMRPPSGER